MHSNKLLSSINPINLANTNKLLLHLTKPSAQINFELLATQLNSIKCESDELAELLHE
jgi:hypothetical protein